MRQIVLDTETTGLRIEDGHRLIEIGCLEMIDRKLTGGRFHQYINPQREVEAGAIAVHGITNDFLQDKPLFSDIADDFMNFIADAELIIHNAAFDVSFINHELKLARLSWTELSDYCRITDSLQMARQLHAGQRNSLDALCKRYSVDNSKRDFHGALLDAHLLAQVYLAMTGGQGSFFDAMTADTASSVVNQQASAAMPIEKHQLVVVKANPDELTAHEDYLAFLKKRGKCLWLDD